MKFNNGGSLFEETGLSLPGKTRYWRQVSTPHGSRCCLARGPARHDAASVGEIYITFLFGWKGSLLNIKRYKTLHPCGSSGGNHCSLMPRLFASRLCPCTSGFYGNANGSLTEGGKERQTTLILIAFPYKVRAGLGEISLTATGTFRQWRWLCEMHPQCLLSGFIPPLREQRERLRRKLILMKGGRPPSADELYYHPPASAAAADVSVVTSGGLYPHMRIKWLHASIDTQQLLLAAGKVVFQGND